MDQEEVKIVRYHEVFNIGSGNPIELVAYVKLIEKQIGKRAQIKYQPMQKGDIKITSADSNKLKKFINFSPTTTIDEGVRYFVEWYKNYYVL